MPEPRISQRNALAVRECWQAAETRLRRDLGLPPEPGLYPAAWPRRMPEYEAVSPGSARRLLAMAEAEQRRRIHADQASTARRCQRLREDRASRRQAAKSATLSLVFSFAAALAGIGAAAAMFTAGQEPYALPFLILPTAGFAVTLFHQTRSKRRHPVQ